MNRSVIILTAIVFTGILHAQHSKLNAINDFQEFVNLAEKGKWKQVKARKGITIHYRKLVLFNTIETREVCIKLNLKTPSADAILANIREPEKISLWNEGIRSVSLLKNSDANWILHCTYNIPFPFAQQDLVASYSLKKKEDVFILSSRSLPDYIKPVKGTKREGYNFSQWQIKPNNKNEFEVAFSAVSLSKSNIPRFIIDPIIQKKLLNSFIRFKETL